LTAAQRALALLFKKLNFRESCLKFNLKTIHYIGEGKCLASKRADGFARSAANGKRGSPVAAGACERTVIGVRVAAYAGAANLNYRQAALAGAAASFFEKKDTAEHAGRRQCPKE
jgi:hypothetical protein